MSIETSHVMKIKHVPDEVIKYLFRRYKIKNLIGDPEACIFMNEKIFNLLGFKGYPFVKVRKKINSNRVFLVQLVPLPSDVPDDNILITNTIYYNLKRRLNNTDKDDSLVIQKIFSSYESFFPTLASKATIAMLSVPFEIEAEITDELLRNYFETPRYLYEDDIFCIHIRQYYPEIFLKWNNHTIEKLYFQVISLEGEKNVNSKACQIGHFILKDKTTLIQTEHGQEFFPQVTNIFTDFNDDSEETPYDSLDSNIINLTPDGLNDKSEDLIQSLKLFFYPKSKTPPLDPLFLVHGPSGVGKRCLIQGASLALGVNLMTVECHQLQGVASGNTEGKLKFIFHRIERYAPCILYLRDIELIFKDKDGHEDSRVISAFLDHINQLTQEQKTINEKFRIVIVGSSNAKNINTAIPTSLLRAFVYTIEIPTPDEIQRNLMLQWIVQRKGILMHDPKSSLERIGSATSGFTLHELESLITQAARIRYKKFRSSMVPPLDVKLEDLEEALAGILAAHADAIGAPRVPAVDWEDIGGLTNVKQEIIRTVTLPLRHPELTKSGLRRSGLLLYGPPGTGKTLLAKAVATQCTLNFLSVKGPELLNMYVGQSEENVREVFDRARSAAPCIIFFDELDSLAPNRGRSGDSGGVMDRVVSQLLAELDGLQKTTHVFVIGATNRPDLIDPALLRPGRFDKLLYVGISDEVKGQISVLESLTRKFDLAEGVDVSWIANHLPPNLTGADMYSVCANAWLNAARTVIKEIETGKRPRDQEVQHIIVSEQDFEEALKTASSSVSDQDILYFASLHKHFSVTSPSSEVKTP